MILEYIWGLIKILNNLILFTINELLESSVSVALALRLTQIRTYNL